MFLLRSGNDIWSRLSLLDFSLDKLGAMNNRSPIVFTTRRMAEDVLLTACWSREGC